MITIVPASAYVRTPWKNGGGWGHDIASRHASDGRLLWRVALADIERDGPFSDYPGVDRSFTIVEGAGVTLTFPGRSLAVHRDETLGFPGAPAPGCACLDGPTRAFNLMATEDAGTAKTIVVQSGATGTLASAAVTIVYALDGDWRLDDSDMTIVLAGDTAIIEGQGGSLSLSGPDCGRVVVATIGG